jgi:hypothetical protein
MVIPQRWQNYIFRGLYITSVARLTVNIYGA